ncbi:MAG TPA: tetratricopeptide repeat protein, partial [Candidatus Polarisedimenticolia bacterium]|nr:tetratricopeptide repeat protein [Candidatus Polarisedimenticolia bacterium]
LIAEIFFPERRTPRREAGRTSNIEQPTTNPDVTGQQPSSNTGVAKVVAIAALLLLLPTIARSSPGSALSDYKSGKFADAQKEFERLAETNSTDARFIFNAGDAAYRATNYDEALKCFTAALASPDVKMQQQAYFNIGNTQFRIGQQKEDLDGMQQQWEEAVKSFQNAVTLNTNDIDAAHNLEFAKKGVVMIQQLKELARRAKSEADQSVRQRNYHRALEIMQQAVQNNLAAKQFTNYVQRLTQIDEIATPHQH